MDTATGVASMSIQVNCSCGRSLRAKDQLAGKRIKCPDCGAIVDIPQPDQGTDHVTGGTTDSSTVPWYKDPILRVAFVIPTLILAGFGLYLYREYATERLQARIVSLVGQADATKEQDPRVALELYGEVLSLLGDDPSTSDSQQIAAQAREQRERLRAVVREMDRREQEELQAQKEREAAERARIAEEQRLAAISANLTGGAWVNLARGDSEILRGLDIVVLPAEVEKDRIGFLIQQAAR